jgi:hypothetical protein
VKGIEEEILPDSSMAILSWRGVMAHQSIREYILGPVACTQGFEVIIMAFMPGPKLVAAQEVISALFTVSQECKMERLCLLADEWLVRCSY